VVTRVINKIYKERIRNTNKYIVVYGGKSKYKLNNTYIQYTTHQS